MTPKAYYILEQEKSTVLLLFFLFSRHVIGH